MNENLEFEDDKQDSEETLKIPKKATETNEKKVIEIK